jgi:hypothetical protein
VQLVVQARVRPSFHTWTDNGLTRALKDTLNESWDSEPDARLTSLCIVERIVDLKNCLNNKFVAKSGKALEKKRVVVVEETSLWVNRNPCMERNLLFDPGSGSVTDTNSVVTMATNLSGGSTDGRARRGVGGGGGWGGEARGLFSLFRIFRGSKCLNKCFFMDGVVVISFISFFLYNLAVMK